MTIFLRLAAILYRELSARPLLAFTISFSVASFITAYADEKERLEKVIADTVDYLSDRADEVEARITRAKAEEMQP